MSAPERYNALKGVQDILSPEVLLWQMVEAVSRDVFAVYGLQEIRTPLIEATGLFLRSIGETTDIVEKEMYTFPDKAGRSITLRPEGTASVVRAYVEHHLHTLPSPQKFYYAGPMFRYERPQKGRFRQFHQIGAEVFGLAAPEVDVELISMLRLIFDRIGMKDVTFEVNSMGCLQCRPAYREALVRFFSDKLEGLCPDCTRRFTSNPLRILDCKVERCGEMRTGAPRVTDFLCAACEEHFNSVDSGLKTVGIPFVVNPNMVRGLDYYTRTTFEVTSEHLGAQKAVAAGGRYDRLVEEFGGPPTPGIGFAIGMERLIALLKERGGSPSPSPDLFIAALGKQAIAEGLCMAERLRVKGFWVEANYERASLKSQLRKADRLGACYAFIIGDDELSSGVVKWKNLKEGLQGEVGLKDVESFMVSARMKTGDRQS